MGFKVTVRTTGASEEFSFQMAVLGGTVDCVVDWGDTTQDNITSSSDPLLVHTYADAGDYDVEIVSGAWTAPRFGEDAVSAAKLIDVKEWGSGYGTDWTDAFKACANLVVTATDAFGMGVIKTATMFSNAVIADPYTTNWDVSSVEDMSSMFFTARAANPDVSNWDTRSLTACSGAFRTAVKANPDVSGWDMSGVTTLANMFRGATVANPDVSGWDVSGVTAANSMFTLSGFTTESYEKLLATWPQQLLQSGVSFHAGTAKYRNVAGRAVLTDDYGWTITDGGADGDNLLDGFLWYGVDGKVYLGDGTTSVGLAAAPGAHKIGVAYGSGLMRLTVDGVDSAEVPYDGTLLDVTLDVFRGADSAHEGGTLQRYAEDYDSAKIRIDGLMA